MDTREKPDSTRRSPRRPAVLDDPAVLGYEHVYEEAGDDLSRVPWAALRVHPLLCAWLDDQPAQPGQRALVVACGLGDDAEELARRGYDVTAFDAAPTAITICRQRFPNSPVDYRVANVFELPAEWRQAFDLVIEIHTIQALPLPRHGDVIAAVAGTVAPGGRVVVVTFGRPEGSEPRNGPPFPLLRSELAAFTDAGLREVDAFEDTFENEHLSPTPLIRWRVIYERPAETAPR